MLTVVSLAEGNSLQSECGTAPSEGTFDDDQAQQHGEKSPDGFNTWIQPVDAVDIDQLYYQDDRCGECDRQPVGDADDGDG